MDRITPKRYSPAERAKLQEHTRDLLRVNRELRKQLRVLKQQVREARAKARTMNPLLNPHAKHHKDGA